MNNVLSTKVLEEADQYQISGAHCLEGASKPSTLSEVIHSGRHFSTLGIIFSLISFFASFFPLL